MTGANNIIGLEIKNKWRDIVTTVIYRNAWTGLDDYRVYIFHINEQTLKIILIIEIYT